MPAAILPLIIKFGLPAGEAAFEFLRDVLAHRKNNPNQTQAEFEVDWVAMQSPYRARGIKWDDAGLSPNAKA